MDHFTALHFDSAGLARILPKAKGYNSSWFREVEKFQLLWKYIQSELNKVSDLKIPASFDCYGCTELTEVGHHASPITPAQPVKKLSLNVVNGLFSALLLAVS
jgi:hypothetical protein